MLTIRNETLMSGIDFLQVLDDRHLLLASELGQMLIVDTQEKTVLKNLSFPEVGWLTAISGFRRAEYSEVWAINGKGRRLYRWTSDQIHDYLKLFHTQLPDGVNPVSLTAYSQKIPGGLPVGPGRSSDYFSNFVPLSDGLAVERILVYGSDDKLYGWADEDTDHLTLERRWKTHPFKQ